MHSTDQVIIEHRSKSIDFSVHRRSFSRGIRIYRFQIVNKAKKLWNLRKHLPEGVLACKSGFLAPSRKLNFFSTKTAQKFFFYIYSYSTLRALSIYGKKNEKKNLLHFCISRTLLLFLNKVCFLSFIVFGLIKISH